MKKFLLIIFVLELLFILFFVIFLTCDLTFGFLCEIKEVGEALNYSETTNFITPSLSIVEDNGTYHKEVVVGSIYSDYKKDSSFYVKEVNLENGITDKESIKDVIFTILNHGYTRYSINCSYDNCYNDLGEFAKNPSFINIINNYLHPYNRFETGDISYMQVGDEEKIYFSFDKIYTANEINVLNEVIDHFVSEIKNLSLKKQIIAFHNYLIDLTKYDFEIVDNLDLVVNQDNAYGALIEKNAICSGYADAMSIFLDRINVLNYRISTLNHVWNLVNLDGTWYHLDATWDDQEYKLYQSNYLLINYDELIRLDKEFHNFEKEYYLEAY